MLGVYFKGYMIYYSFLSCGVLDRSIQVIVVRFFILWFFQFFCVRFGQKFSFVIISDEVDVFMVYIEFVFEVNVWFIGEGYVRGEQGFFVLFVQIG